MSPWEPTAAGATLGQPGPEGGIIDRDESTPDGVRLILEADPSRDFYAVTALIPDWLIHPRFFDARGPADLAFEAQRAPLLELFHQLPRRRPPPGHPDTFAAGEKLAAFTVRFG